MSSRASFSIGRRPTGAGRRRPVAEHFGWADPRGTGDLKTDLMFGESPHLREPRPACARMPANAPQGSGQSPISILEESPLAPFGAAGVARDGENKGNGSDGNSFTTSLSRWMRGITPK